MIWVVLSVIGVMSSIFFKLINEFYAKHDANRIKITFKIMICQGILIMMISAGVIYKYDYSVVSCFLLFFMWYLSVTAYIDYKTKMVYSSLNVFALLAGIIFFSYSLRYYNVWKNMDIGSLVIWIIFLVVCKALHLYGAGDFDVLMVETIYFCSIPEIRQPIGGTLLFVMMGALGVHFIIHYKEIDFLHLKLKKSVAFVPAIFISTIINIFI